MIVLVPAYEPDERMLRLVEDLAAADPGARVVVVDDGSGPASRAVLDEVGRRGATVLRHEVNRGKGRALKTGFAHVAREHPWSDVVCADCDGQHSVLDVVRVGREVARTRSTVLGVRRLTGHVPLRSRLGNATSRAAMALATRRDVVDTQTGLRGYPASLLPWLLRVEGERYEYETALLVEAARRGLPVEQVEVATIYLQHNASSHFRPVIDSVRVLVPVVRFAAVSLVSFALDAVLLLVLHAATGALLPSVVLARAVSSAANFLANRHLVFGARDVPLRTAAARYWSLAAVLVVAGYALLAALTSLGLALLPAKLATDALLLATSFLVQRHGVFRAHSSRTAGSGPAHTAAEDRSTRHLPATPTGSSS